MKRLKADENGIVREKCEKGRKKFSLGLDFSGGRVERRKNLNLNEAREDREVDGEKGGSKEPLPRQSAMGLLRSQQGQVGADGERRIASLKAA